MSMVCITRGLAILTLHSLRGSILFQNVARCIISPNWPMPLGN